MTEKDLELIGRAARGDREAFDALIGPRWDRIFRIAWRITSDREEGQDVAQRACLRLWENLSRFRLGEDLDGWIYRMTVNLALDAIRRRRARPETPVAFVPEPESLGRGPLDSVLAHELERALQDVTRDLAPRQKAAFVLVRIEGLEPTDAAAVLGVAPSTVRNHLFQARAAISARLRERHPKLLGELGVDPLGEEES
ncbi:MAG: RNA polymerase sigma factor [Acidobacteriota bacterium]